MMKERRNSSSHLSYYPTLRLYQDDDPWIERDWDKDEWDEEEDWDDEESWNEDADDEYWDDDDDDDDDELDDEEQGDFLEEWGEENN